jgi:uncharacterized protein YgbK (DUF1537 family)
MLHDPLPILDRAATFAALPPEWPIDPQPAIRAALARSERRLVVLDDDPTGTQTVHDLPVLTSWEVETLTQEFTAGTPVFYILTNSRSLPSAPAAALMREIAVNLRAAARRAGVEFSVVSRSDSTLGGHYPIETDVLAEAIGQLDAVCLIIPFFEAGGRHTIGDVHYVAEGDKLVPAAQTPFARDAVFGYRASNLRAWVEEKTRGRINTGTVASITIDAIRRRGPAAVQTKLAGLPGGAVCIVNAATRRDMEVFVLGLLGAEAAGRRFIYRTAASFVAARAGLEPRALLTAAALPVPAAGGGLIVVGSYVPKTTEQLGELLKLPGLAAIELQVDALLATGRREVEIARVRTAAEEALRAGRNTVLYTSRRLVTGGDEAENLRIGQSVSDALIEVTGSITVRPRYVIAKGGITSSDVATKALRIRRATVAGQILPGVPVWLPGAESRWPGIAYVVFPGNVGGPGALREAVDRLAAPAIPENFLRHGAAADLPVPRPLRAGPLTMDYENGDLRYLRLGGREVVRRIYVAVRDRNWGTVPTTLTPVQTEVRADSFDLVYEIVAKQDEIDFRWRATLTGTADGRLEFVIDGAAHSAFLRNRIGFCILHPAAECCGARCRVRFEDGRVIDATFPKAIAPENPFVDLTGLDHEVTPGVWCRMEFEGEVFEMEDQRNWVDASFKTFCTPLRRPFPVAVAVGEKVRQAVRLRVEGAASPSAVGRGVPAERRVRDGSPGGFALPQDIPAGIVRIDLTNAPRTRLPALGLTAASHGQTLTEREIARLRALRPAHLRIELRPATDDCAAKLRAASVLGVPLEVALTLTDAAGAELRTVAAAMEAVRPPVARWLVFHAKELAATNTRWIDLARAHLAKFSPAAFVTGTDYWFAQLNRERPPQAGLDGVCFTLTPQVHASDHASLVETLAEQAELVANASEFSAGVPLTLSPVTLRMRNNPAATGPERATPPGELPACVDPRQMSLCGAGWTLGSVKYLAEAGVAHATYYETTGWLGVMETEAGSPLPKLFPSIPGAVFPLYHILADLNEFAGAEVVHCVSSSPLQVEALVLVRNGVRRVLLANLSPQAETVAFPVSLAGGDRGTTRRLHSANAIAVMMTPAEFRETSAAASADGGFWLFDLAPFEMLNLDVPVASTRKISVHN